MENLEEREQILIQHLRTAGLRQAKEASLVEEVFDLRKERRRYFSQLQEEMRRLDQVNKDLNLELDQVKQHLMADLTALQKKHEREVTIRDEQLRLLEQSMKAEKEAQVENVKLTEKKSYDRLKASYESKLSLLEEKYKASVAAVVEREASITQSVLQHQQRQRILEDEIVKLQEELSHWKNEVKVSSVQEREIKAENYTLLTEIAQQKKELEVLIAKGHEDKITHQNEIDKLRRDHEQTLQEIDEKIRKMLESKVAKSKRYRDLYEQEKRKVQHLQNLLEDLNRQIS
eukprot:gene8883-9798_t